MLIRTVFSKLWLIIKNPKNLNTDSVIIEMIIEIIFIFLFFNEFYLTNIDSDV